MVIFTKYPIFLLLSFVLCSESPLDKIEEESEFNKNLPQIEIFTHNNCSNMTFPQMSVVLYHYPNVKVRCQAESSILIPTELEVPENINNNYEDEISWLMGTRKYFYFNELKSISEANATKSRFPISPCFRTSGNMGSGSYEISFSLRMLILGLAEMTRSLPFFSSQGVFKGSQAFDGELSYNVACAFRNTSVRPVVEMTTIKTHEKFRKWTVDPNKKDFVKYSEWEPIDRVRIIEDTLMFACVSEKNVSNICTWNDDEAISVLKDTKLYL